MVPDELLKFKGQSGFEYLDRFGNSTKKCSQCGEVKDSALFYENSAKKDGLDSKCRECRKEVNRDYMRKHRERNAGKPKDPNYHKTCPQCGVTKSSVDFYRDRSTKDGLHPLCKDCQRKVGQAFRKDNPDHRKKRLERVRIQREVTRAVATASGRYSPEEDLVVLDNTLTTYQKAIKLGRTLASVDQRKKTLKRKGITHVSNYPQI